MSTKPVPTLVTRILRSLLIQRGQNLFKDWFTDEEIALFRSGTNQLHVLEPYFERYQQIMESNLKEICTKEGIGDSDQEIIQALEEIKDSSNDWKKLDKMVDSMTDPNVFYKLMRRKADKNYDNAKKQFEGLKRVTGKK